MKLPNLIILTVLAAAPAGHAGKLQAAAVTRVVNNVTIFRPGQAVEKAAVGNIIRGQTSLQTGRDSRSELRFEDSTITRIGANSIFSFERGTRDLHLQQGTILLQTPKRAGGARIRTATVTAAVTGTTILMEYREGKWVKVIVLEGELEFFLNSIRRRVKVGPGQLLVMPADGKHVPQPTNIDVQHLMNTSVLAGAAVLGPLPEASLALINNTITTQRTLISKGVLSNPGTNPATNPVVGGRPPTTGANVTQTLQSVTDSSRAPERQAQWYDYRPSPGR